MAQAALLTSLVGFAIALSACTQPADDASVATRSTLPPIPDGSGGSDTPLPSGIQATKLCFRVENPAPGLGVPTTSYWLRGTLFTHGPLRADMIGVVFIHGGGWDARSWLRNPDHVMPYALAEAGYATLTYDRLGQGASRPSVGTPVLHAATFLDHVDMLHQLVGQLKAGTSRIATDAGCAAERPALGLGIPRIVLTGASLGGAMSQNYAGRFGDVDAVIPQDWSNMGMNPEPTVYIARAMRTMDENGYGWFPSTEDDCRALIFFEPGSNPKTVDDTCLEAFPQTAVSELPNLLRVMFENRRVVGSVPAGLPVLLTFADESLPFKPKHGALPDSRKEEAAFWKQECPCRDQVEVWTQTRAGHAMHMALTAPTLTARILTFLDENGLGPRAALPMAVFEGEAKGCEESSGFFQISIEKARELLPAGFQPGDAGHIVGVPSPAGTIRPGVLAAAIECAGVGPTPYSEGVVLVTIQPPNVAHVGGARYHTYELARVMGPGPLRDALDALGWKLSAGEVAATVDGSQTLHGVGTVRDAQGVVFEFKLDAPNGFFRLQGAFRQWQAVPDGLAYIETDLDVKASTGPGTCYVRSGTPAHHAVGATACAGGEGFPYLIRDWSAAVRVMHLPGARVVA